MFKRLTANHQEFTPIDFRPGFNVVIAERASDSSDQDSRNARGKTTLLLIINYLLGGNLHKDLRPLADDDWEFTLELEMFGGIVAVSRALKGGERVCVNAQGAAIGALEPWLVEGSISLSDWKEALGLALFRLEPPPDESVSGLSVRTLLSYVIRTETPSSPLKVLTQQGAVSSREHVSFLLGLDWTVVRDLAETNKGIEQLKTISEVTDEGLVSTMRPEEELVLERATIKDDVDEWNERISTFRILEDPNSLVIRADELTEQIVLLRDEQLVDRRMMDLYRSSINEADSGSSNDTLVQELFAASGAIFAEGFTRQIDDVRAFHTSLLRDRHQFLQVEINSLKVRIADRSDELNRLDAQRDQTLRTLDTGGALEELNSMRTELAGALARMALVDLQIEQSREVAVKQSELKLDRSRQRTEANRELTSSRTKLDEFADRFSRKMKKLYGKDAALTVSVDDSGYKFALKVTGGGSTGVSRMTLFCFDLTMLEEGVRSSHHPDFLIHDSSVFDGVDPRQRATAFRFVNEMFETSAGQYICTINSNDVPAAVMNEEWFQSGIVRTILDTEVGGLVGRDF